MTGEVPGAEMVLAHPTNYRLRPAGISYDLVVVHITDGHANPRPVAEMWQAPKHGSSAHFVVGQDGTLLQCVPLRCAAYHAHSVNSHSVGIEHCARSPRELGATDAGMPVTDAQWATSASLVARLLLAAGLPPTRAYVKGHAEADVNTDHADCPTGVAGGWDWDAYMARVRAAYAALAAPTPAVG